MQYLQYTIYCFKQASGFPEVYLPQHVSYFMLYF